jgi:hypothetical protein
VKRSSLAMGLAASSLALFTLACEVEDDAGEELIPENGAEEDAES